MAWDELDTNRLKITDPKGEVISDEKGSGIMLSGRWITAVYNSPKGTLIEYWQKGHPLVTRLIEQSKKKSKTNSLMEEGQTGGRPLQSVLRKKPVKEEDILATRLRECLYDVEGELKQKAVDEIAKKNGFDPRKWDHLNNGQKRMNLGNRLRSKMKKGETINIMGMKI